MNHMDIRWYPHLYAPHVRKKQEDGIWACRLIIVFHLSKCGFNQSAQMFLQGPSDCIVQDQNVAAADVRKGRPAWASEKRTDHGMSLSNEFLHPKIEWLVSSKIHWDHISHQNFTRQLWAVSSSGVAGVGKATSTPSAGSMSLGSSGKPAWPALPWEVPSLLVLSTLAVLGCTWGHHNGYNYGTNLNKLGYGGPTNFVRCCYPKTTPGCLQILHP